MSIVVRLIDSGKFTDKKILIIDKEEKNKNDRTWCFWEKENGYFEDIVYRRWSRLKFKTEKENIDLKIAPYQYKMIRGIDFYNHCFAKFKIASNISVTYGNISIQKDQKIFINHELLNTEGAIVFNSLYPGNKDSNSHYLLQHFKGWIIETSDELPEDATLMDFSIDQHNGSEFIYVLPLTHSKVLIEYTLFSETILREDQYNQKLEEYIRKKVTTGRYNIIETEFGIIPMTNKKFTYFEDGMFHIGTAGGQTKSSTGYTFKFIQEHSEIIVQQLIDKGVPDKKLFGKKRFQFYDSTLLNILAGKKLEGKEIFTRLFKHNNAYDVFKFLDNETSFAEELKLINTLPKKYFIKAGLSEFIKLIR